MILHKLLLRYFRRGPDEEFYRLQAVDTVQWLKRVGLAAPGSTALDIGCGHGVLGRELERIGVSVSYADRENLLLDKSKSFHFIDLDEGSYTSLPPADLVLCSNVLEHLANPDLFFSNLHYLAPRGGHIYLSWTNWLSPFGGHDWAPFHYLGARLGPKIFQIVTRRKAGHVVGRHLFKTYIGRTIRAIRSNPQLRVCRLVPRYYSEIAPLAYLPLIREFLCWNCAVLIEKTSHINDWSSDHVECPILSPLVQSH